MVVVEPLESRGIAGPYRPRRQVGLPVEASQKNMKPSHGDTA
jgi:hypothetical protein